MLYKYVIPRIHRMVDCLQLQQLKTYVTRSERFLDLSIFFLLVNMQKFIVCSKLLYS